MQPDNLEQVAIKKLNERVEKLELENASLVQDVNLLNVLKPGVDILQGENGNFDNIPTTPDSGTGLYVVRSEGSTNFTVDTNDSNSDNLHTFTAGGAIASTDRLEGHFVLPSAVALYQNPYMRVSNLRDDTTLGVVPNEWAVANFNMISGQVIIEVKRGAPATSWNGTWSFVWRVLMRVV